MVSKRKIIFIIALILPLFGVGQGIISLSENTYFEADYGYGSIMPHHSSIRYLLEDHIRTLDIKFVKSTSGKKYWNQLFRYPDYGLGFYRSNLGNNEVFGYTNALYGFTKIPFFSTPSGSKITYQIAVGAAYVTNHFDINTNYKNLAIGTHFNIYIDFSLNSYIVLSRNFGLTNNIRFTHVSNGNVQQPNYGLNILSASIGLAYQFNSDYHIKEIIDLPEIESKNNFLITLSGGAKSINHYTVGTYLASSLVFDYNRRYSLKGAWGVGTDVFFDATNRQFSENKDKNDIINSDLYQVGIHVLHDAIMNKMTFTVQLGVYLYAPVETEAFFYTRTGLRYAINKKWNISMTLKSHYAIASFIEWGVGYSILAK